MSYFNANSVKTELVVKMPDGTIKRIELTYPNIVVTSKLDIMRFKLVTNVNTTLYKGSVVKHYDTLREAYVAYEAALNDMYCSSGVLSIYDTSKPLAEFDRKNNVVTRTNI